MYNIFYISISSIVVSSVVQDSFFKNGNECYYLKKKNSKMDIATLKGLLPMG